MIEDPKKPAPISERGRVAQAYARLFGTDDNHRNEDQRVVWQDMERRGYIRRPALNPNADGSLCPIKQAQAEGQRIFMLDVQLLVHEGHNQDPEAKPKQRGKSVT